MLYIFRQQMLQLLQWEPMSLITLNKFVALKHEYKA